MTTAGTAALLGGLATAVSVPLFAYFAGLDYFRFGESFLMYIAGGFAVVAAVVLLPVTLLGMLLPAVWTSLSCYVQPIGPLVGRVAMMNSAAAAIGALVTSLRLLPLLGLLPSFALISLLFTTAAVVFGSARWSAWRRTLVGGVGVAGVLPLLPLEFIPIWQFGAPNAQLLRRWESSYGWIDVVQTGSEGALEIRQNLHYRLGAAGRNAERESRQAHLPLLLHPEPRNVLFLGVGTGITAAGAIPHQSVRNVDVVELIPEVIEASRLLSADNRDVVEHSWQRTVLFPSLEGNARQTQKPTRTTWTL